MQKDEILKMVVALKAIKLPVSAIEKELGFSNGLIGKASKGETELSEEKFLKLEEYFKEKCGVKETVQPATQMVMEPKGIKIIPSKEIDTKVRETMDKINKDFGAGTIMMFGDKPDSSYQTVSTGSLQLDYALGIGGLPRGRIVEIFGWESSGKTTIALNAIADAQKQGLRCLLVDAENAFDPEYADALGVVVDNLQYCQPSSGEEGLEVADRLINAGKVDVVVFDSVAALVPKSELEGEMGDSKMGLHARLMSQACRKMVGPIAKHNVLCIFINQLRHKIGVVYGSPEVTTGGNALQFYSSVRLEVKRSTTEKNSIMNGEQKEGNQTTVKVIKNKCAPPFRTAQFYIMYGEGIDRISEIIEMAIELEVIKKAGSWFSYKGSQLCQGKEGIKQIFKDHPEMAMEIETQLNLN
jgi:recombination protein RecA